MRARGGRECGWGGKAGRLGARGRAPAAETGVSRRGDSRIARPCLPLWGRCPVRTLGGRGRELRGTGRRGRRPLRRRPPFPRRGGLAPPANTGAGRTSGRPMVVPAMQPPSPFPGGHPRGGRSPRLVVSFREGQGGEENEIFPSLVSSSLVPFFWTSRRKEHRFLLVMCGRGQAPPLRRTPKWSRIYGRPKVAPMETWRRTNIRAAEGGSPYGAGQHLLYGITSFALHSSLFTLHSSFPSLSRRPCRSARNGV